MGYFRQLPDFNYVSRLDEKVSSTDYVEVKNLFRRAKVREDLFQNFTAFTRYTIVGDERPDNVAENSMVIQNWTGLSYMSTIYST